MSEEVEALRAEVAALRAEVAGARHGESKAITRRRLLTGLAGLGAAGAVGVTTASPAGADDNDPILLGASNAASSTTTLQNDGDPDDTAFMVRTSAGAAIFASTGPDAEPLVGNIKRAIYAVAGPDEEGPAVSNAIGAYAADGFALEGVNDSLGFPTVGGTNQGAGPGVGAMSFGHGPQLLLAREDLAPSGHPIGYAEPGAIRFDGAGDLWLCLTGGGDSPDSTWTRLLREDTAVGRVIPIPPVRALDTRATGGRSSGSPAVPGQKKGPLKGGETLTLDLAGVSPIPASATGVIGNLIVLSPNYTGYLRAAPSGAPLTATAVSFTNGDLAGNAYTVGIGPAGVSFRASGTTTNHYELVVDITAYIT